MSQHKKLKKIIPIAVIVLFVGAVAILNRAVFTPKAVVPPAVAGSSGGNVRALVFSDEFNDDKVDDSKWNFCYDDYLAKYDGCTNYGNWEGQWYRRSQVTEKAGSLVLTANKQTARGDNRYKVEQDYPYVSGMVSTGAKDLTSTPKWDGQYGYYEARILTPKGQALWPAFWLLPIDRSWPPEIDVMEVLGHNTHEVLNSYHWKNTDGSVAQDSTRYTMSESASDNWHVYGVDWHEGGIDWYIDGKLVKSATGDNIPTKRMQIILNLAVGGMLPGQIDATTPASAIMLVDYVRVYDKK